jgi:hypothetical protein
MHTTALCCIDESRQLTIPWVFVKEAGVEFNVGGGAIPEEDLHCENSGTCMEN